MSFCLSRAAVELIFLSVHLSLHFGSPVDTAVDSPVVVGCWKLIRLSVRLSRASRRLSYRLSWPFTQLGGSDANKHTRKVGHFHAAGELIRLSVHLSLRFGSPVDLPVVSPVVAGCWKLIRLSVRLSCRLSWPFTQLGCSAANKHTRKAGHFHAAVELIRLSERLSLHFGSPVDSPVVVGCMKLVRVSYHLSYHLSCHDLQDYRWRFALSAQLKSRQPKSAPDSRHPGIGVAL